MAAQGAHAQWSSKWAFMLATIGSAVGLGNIWKFPYEAGEGGGGVFVLVYLAFVFLVGTPILIAELSIGRMGQQSPVNAVRKVATSERRSPLWRALGWSGVIGSFLIISYYSVVGGWVIAYLFKALSGFGGLTAAQSVSDFDTFIADPWLPILTHAAFMGITVYIVAQGVKGGLEKAVTYLMPALFVMLIALVIFSAAIGNFGGTIDFLFGAGACGLEGANLEECGFTAPKAIQAVGLAFFTLSLAMGSIMTYGSYLTPDINIPNSAVTISAADSGVALLAGLAIFPIVFSFPEIEAGAGGGLVFISLPVAFAQMPFGAVFGSLFFLLLLIAAITSALSLLEPSVEYIEEQASMSRRRAALTIGGLAFLLGTLSSLGQTGNVLGEVKLFGLSIMDAKDYLTNNIMMPLGGVATAIFVGWFVRRRTMLEELAISEPGFKIWYFLVRYVCPIAVAAVFISIIADQFGGWS